MSKQVVSVRVAPSLIAKMDARGKRGDVIEEALTLFFDGRRQDSLGESPDVEVVQAIAEATVPPNEDEERKRLADLGLRPGAIEQVLAGRKNNG